MNEIDTLIEGMSEQELQTIMNTQFPEELEKQAEAAVASSDLGDSLYAYGAYIADREVAELETDSELSKEASAEFDAAEQEIMALVDSGVASLGVGALEDRVELQKQAQAAAGLILEGYTDQMEKIAKAKAGKLEGLKKALSKKLKAVRGHAAEAGKYVGKHHKPLAAAAGLGAISAAAGMKAHEQMSKKASEFTVEQIIDISRECDAEVACVNDGLEKLAAKAGKKSVGMLAAMGKKLTAAKEQVGEKAQAASKYMKKNWKPVAGGAAAGAAVGAGAAHAAHEMKD